MLLIITRIVKEMTIIQLPFFKSEILRIIYNILYSEDGFEIKECNIS